MNEDIAVCTICGDQLVEGDECYVDSVAGCVCENCIDALLDQRKVMVYSVIDRLS